MSKLDGMILALSLHYFCLLHGNQILIFVERDFLIRERNREIGKETQGRQPKRTQCVAEKKTFFLVFPLIFLFVEWHQEEQSSLVHKSSKITLH